VGKQKLTISDENNVPLIKNNILKYACLMNGVGSSALQKHKGASVNFSLPDSEALLGF